jgi:hypothetical protein
MPIWVTTRFVNSYRLLHGFAQRIAGYLKSNGRIYEWTEDGELLECHENEVIADARARSRELRECQIETRSDGLYMLQTKASARRSERQRVLEAVEKIHSRNRG